MAAIADADIVAAVRSLLPDVRAITLFGSRADGSAGADRDFPYPA